ncbi:MAG: histone deacetylase family protein [Candidatus Hydrothermarchaeota archaeon]
MRISIIYHPKYLEHDPGSRHPENPKRLQSVIDLLEVYEIFQKVNKIEPKSLNSHLVEKTHESTYVKLVKDLSSRGGMLTLDTPVYKNTYDIALLSVSGAIEAVKETMENHSLSFALIRPPGHHAGKDFGGGFCYFNNIAVCANYLKGFLERILIIDFDAHHGNGTENIFYSDPGVLYFSIHQHPLYPGTGSIDDVGKGEGEGFNINAPVPPKTSGAGALAIMNQILLPVTESFKPEFILVSSGFDGYFLDPISDLGYSINTFVKFASLIREISEKCKNRVTMLLEGGYHPDGISYGVLSILNELGDLELSIEEPNPPPEQKITERVSEIINRIRGKISPYWDI